MCPRRTRKTFPNLGLGLTFQQLTDWTGEAGPAPNIPAQALSTQRVWGLSRLIAGTLRPHRTLSKSPSLRSGSQGPGEGYCRFPEQRNRKRRKQSRYGWGCSLCSLPRVFWPGPGSPWPCLTAEMPLESGGRNQPNFPHARSHVQGTKDTKRGTQVPALMNSWSSAESLPRAH